MQKNQVGTLLNKQQYAAPQFVVNTFDVSDVVTASGTGEMTWNWDRGDWSQSRDNTFVD